MDTMAQEKIRQSVRDTYGKIANAGGIERETNEDVSCCGPSVAAEESTGESCGCGCGAEDISAEDMQVLMGYSKEALASAPDGANMGLGCGNPVALASLKPGETVVDLGSGGGFDCFLSAKAVGETGSVIGVDMTSDMVTKARGNAEKVGTKNVEFRLGEIEHLPIADNTADIIMSNCVINLSPDKLSVYREAYRVLKPGGRLAISDIVATAALPQKIQEDLALVAACVGGAATIDDTEELLREAGFKDIKIKSNDMSRELLDHWDPETSENVGDYIVSAYIEGIKP